MNPNQILSNILSAAQYPEDKKEEFINTFYQYLFSKLLTEIEMIDKNSAQQLANAIKSAEKNPGDLNKVWQTITADPKIKEKINSITDQVIGEVVDDIADSATDSQKEQILASLPA